MGIEKERINNKKVKNKKVGKKKHKGLKIFGTIVISLFSFACITGLIIVGYVYSYMTDYINGEVAIDLNEYQSNQSQTSIIYAYDENGEVFELQRLHGDENRIYVGLDEIPKHLQNAFIALEDARFPTHEGVDWIRFVAVFVKDRLSTGGSSITQQLVKNITGDREANFVRKFNEICNALNLEKNFSKDEILEAYLNTLYLGSGCYGVKTACEKYFGKDVSEINIAEAACIASITKAPYTYNPLVNPEKNKERRNNECLASMLEEGYITKAEYDEAVNYEIIFTNSPDYVPDEEEEVEENTEEEEQEEVWSFYVDFIVDTLIDEFMTTYDMDERQAIQKIYYGGLKIYAAVDLNAQATLEDVYINRKTFPDESNKEIQAQSAMTIMDYNGRVIAICGEAGEKSGNRCLNRASDSPRQPGSSIKPISAYAPLIEEKKGTWSTMVLDKAFAYNGTLWPKNYSGNKGSGSYVTVQNALARSLNTVPGRIVYEILGEKEKGLDKSYSYLTNTFRISTAVEKYDKTPAPLATGAMRHGATTLEMAAAYATFGNGGKYYKPYCYYKVTNSDGSQVYFDNTAPSGKQVISEDTSDIMCELLQTVVTDSVGTAKAYKINNFQTMAKTGTTSDNYDRWFVGGTPYYVAAVWYGYDLNKTISNVSGNPAGKIFKEVLNELHKDLPEKEFPKSSIVVEKKYCRATGLIAGTNCSTGTGWYSLKNMPETCTSCTGGEQNIVDPETPETTTPEDPGYIENPETTTPEDPGYIENPGTTTPEDPGYVEEPGITDDNEYIGDTGNDEFGDNGDTASQNEPYLTE